MPRIISGETHHPVDRRQFLTQSSLALAGMTIGTRLRAQTPELVHLPTRSPRPVSAFIRSVSDPETLRKLAATAIETAMQAGADWADIRVGDRRDLIGNRVMLSYGFGIRVRVGGAEAFLGGGSPTQERVMDAARSAVATARGIAKSPEWSAELARPLAATPVVKGEWRAPIAIDPFTVPVDDHWLVGRSNGGSNDVRLKIFNSDKVRFGGASWYAETRVFASSEGSATTQFLGGATAQTWNVDDQSWRRWTGTMNLISVPGYDIESCTAGFEILLQHDRHDQLEALGREVERYRALPYGHPDVGRYNIVLDGPAHAALLRESLVQGLSLHRALGDDADVDGMSPFAPPTEWIGQTIASPLMTLQADAGAPRYGAAAWDDEGVATKTVPLIVNGKLVHYLTSRATAPALETSTNGKTDVSTALSGTTRTPDVTHQPLEMPPSVTVLPGKDGSLTALAKQLGTGMLVRGAYVTVNPQGTGGFINPTLAFEVRRGELVRRIGGFRFSFNSKKMLQSMIALGNAETLHSYTTNSVVSFPWLPFETVVRAPAAAYKNLDVTTNLLLTS